MRTRMMVLVVVVVGLSMPAFGYVFKATRDGSFANARSSVREGYANGGASAGPRITKGTQGMGWWSFKGAVEATNSQLTLADYLAAYPNLTACFYVRFKNVTLGDATGYLVSLRCGNQGDLVEDQGGTLTYDAPATGITGSSEMMAWRVCQPQGATAFTQFGDGIYYQNNPAATGGTQGEPWITPSGRIANGGMTPFQIGPNQPVRYDTGLNPWQPADNSFWNPAAPATGLYRGFFFDTPAKQGRAIWALEDILGFWSNQTSDHTVAQITDAGQIINGGATPTVVDMVTHYIAPDPVTGIGEWLAIPIDNAFLRDMVNNPQNKGFVFDNTASGLVRQSGDSPDFWSRDEAPDTYAPYLLITGIRETPCPGDVDANGRTDGDDLAILAYAWLATPTSANWYAPADLTADGVVNGDDLATLAYGWLCGPM